MSRPVGILVRVQEGTLSRFLRKAFAPSSAQKGPAASKPRSLPSDLGHALTALQKGWITREQLQRARQNCAADDTLLKRLCDDGALDEAKLAMLFGSSLLIASPETLKKELAQPTESQPLGGYDPGNLIGGRYRILEIKRGGFGVVYICEPLLHPGQRVALKAILRQHLAKPEALEMFCVEAANWIALGAHPNIVLAHGVTAHARMRFVAMEYIEGAQTLAHEIAAGSTDWRRALSVGLDVTRALVYAHQRSGLVHGDLKPLNLLIDRSGTVKVTDFGLSISQEAFSAGNDPNVLVGTEGFIAPEMYLGKTARTTATDVYAFGVILYQTATGRLPFPLGQALPPNLSELPPDPRSLKPEIPDELATLILTCLNREPERRPPSFAALARQLEELHATLLGQAPPSAPAPGMPAQVDAFLNLSQSWYLLRKLDKAEHFAREALRLDAGNWKAHYALGKALGAQGDATQNFQPALTCFAQAQELAPKELAPVSDAAYVRLLSGNRAAAVKLLERALEICRNRGSFAGLDSRLIADLMEPNSALTLFDHILRKVPDDVGAWNERISVLRRLRRFDEALASAEQVVRLNPAFAESWKKKAIVLMELGRFDEALASAQQALNLDPLLAEGYAAKATALAQVGRLEEARHCVAQGLARLPGHPLLLQARQMFSADRVIFKS